MKTKIFSAVIALAVIFSACNQDEIYQDELIEDAEAKALFSHQGRSTKVTKADVDAALEAWGEYEQITHKKGKIAKVVALPGDVTLVKSILGHYSIRFGKNTEEGSFTVYTRSLGRNFYEWNFDTKDWQGKTFVFPILTDVVLWYSAKSFTPAVPPVEDPVYYSVRLVPAGDANNTIGFALVKEGDGIPWGQLEDALKAEYGPDSYWPTMNPELWGITEDRMFITEVEDNKYGTCRGPWGYYAVFAYVEGTEWWLDDWILLPFDRDQNLPYVDYFVEHDIAISVHWEYKPKPVSHTVNILDFEGKIVHSLEVLNGELMPWDELCKLEGFCYEWTVLNVPDNWEIVDNWWMEHDITDVDIRGGWFVYRAGTDEQLGFDLSGISDFKIEEDVDFQIMTRKVVYFTHATLVGAQFDGAIYNSSFRIQMRLIPTPEFWANVNFVVHEHYSDGSVIIHEMAIRVDLPVVNYPTNWIVTPFEVEGTDITGKISITGAWAAISPPVASILQIKLD